MDTKVQIIFDRLWKDYITLTPDAKRVYDLFVQEGEEVVNDHIAFRTFDDERVNIDRLVQPLLDAGYMLKSEYNFEEKHLFARHFEYKLDKLAPRVFISQLITGDFSEFLQNTVKEKLDLIPRQTYESDELIYQGNLWGLPTYEVYEKLRQESEYAAWLYVYGFHANHFTVSVNHLKIFQSVEDVNAFLKKNGFLINDAGGEVKGSPDQLLEQSSIKAPLIDVDFQEGTKQIPSCYYEFARRYQDANGELFPGFIAKSANKIFESTDYYKKQAGGHRAKSKEQRALSKEL